MRLGYSDLIRSLKEKDFVRHWPIFKHHVEPEGLMPDTPAAHACWYYCMCVVGLLKELDAGNAEYEGERDHTDMRANIIMSVAALYNLESPSEIVKLFPFAKQEAERLGLGWDVRMEEVNPASFRTMDN